MTTKIQGSRNLVEIVENNGLTTVLKTYDDINRYSCEVKYLYLFKENGFNVPKLLASDSKKMTNTIEFISGQGTNNLNKEQVTRCVTELVSIYNTFKLEKSVTDHTNKKDYVQITKECITDFCQRFKIEIDFKTFDSAVKLLNDKFIGSIFKDAKPENFILTEEKVYLIDFDYVVPSFYLADLAKLLNGINSLTFDEKYELALMFNTKVKTRISNKSLKTLLILALIVSSQSAIKFNKNLSQETQNILNENTLEYLKLLNIVKGNWICQ